MTRTCTLPSVSLGGYGARLRELSDETLATRFMEHGRDVERLTRELAVAVERRDLASRIWRERQNRRLHDGGH